MRLYKIIRSVILINLIPLQSCSQKEKRQDAPLNTSDRQISSNVVSDLPREQSSIAIRSENDKINDALLKQKQGGYAEVFDISLKLDPDSDRDRAEAWEKLQAVEPSVPLSGEQISYADGLIEKYKNAPMISKLMIWRLIHARLYEQGASPTSRIVDDYQDLRSSMPKKLNELLYSALNETSEGLDITSATFKARELLRQATRD
jgi:hypothetical protein